MRLIDADVSGIGPSAEYTIPIFLIFVLIVFSDKVIRKRGCFIKIDYYGVGEELIYVGVEKSTRTIFVVRIKYICVDNDARQKKQSE